VKEIFEKCITKNDRRAKRFIAGPSFDLEGRQTRGTETFMYHY